MPALLIRSSPLLAMALWRSYKVLLYFTRAVLLHNDSSTDSFITCCNYTQKARWRSSLGLSEAGKARSQDHRIRITCPVQVTADPGIPCQGQSVSFVVHRVQSLEVPPPSPGAILCHSSSTNQGLQVTSSRSAEGVRNMGSNKTLRQHKHSGFYPVTICEIHNSICRSAYYTYNRE